MGTEPANVAFDGAYIWVTNYGSGNVTKLLASTGAVLGTFTVGGQPFGLAFDRTNIWVGNAVTELRASDGKILGTFPVNSVGYGVIFDGTYIWTTNDLGTVTRLKLDGTNAGIFNGGQSPVRPGLRRNKCLGGGLHRRTGECNQDSGERRKASGKCHRGICALWGCF